MADDVVEMLADARARVQDEDAELSKEDYERFKAALQRKATQDGNWAGVPMLVHDVPLTLEPRYPYQGLNGLMYTAEGIEKAENDSQSLMREMLANAICDVAESQKVHELTPSVADAPEFREAVREKLLSTKDLLQSLLDQARADMAAEAVKEINSWYSYQKNATITVIRNKAGRSEVLVDYDNVRAASANKANILLKTMGVAAEAWKPEVELEAMSKLKELIPSHLFGAYLLTGAFIESSPRSGLTYIFRKARPTIAMGVCPRTKTMRLVSILCLHPIGFYSGTWCGVMTPTDDVIAHLLLMRGDEYKFWKKANHHHAWEPEAGL